MRKGIESLILDFIDNEYYKTMTRKEIANIFVEKKSDFQYIYDILDKLEREGKIIVNNQYVDSIKKSKSFFVGKISVKKRGFAFFQEEGREEEFFISIDNRNGAYDGDTVLVSLLDENKDGEHLHRRKRDEGSKHKEEGYDKSEHSEHREAYVVKVIKRGKEVFAGVLDYRKDNAFGFVIVDDQKFDSDIFIPKKHLNSAQNGDKVICEINNWDGNNPEGVIKEVLGKTGENDVEVLSIIRTHNLDIKFNDKVIKNLEKIEDYVTETEIKGREDLRNLQTYTIDGDDSKDFDDAVSVEKKSDGNYELGVHIADVTHYVKEGSALDKEARERGTSVYLVDKVIPMLPKKLSNGICSLNPLQDRLTLSCIMTVDKNTGNVINYRICKSIINSKARMTYREISNLLENNDEDMLEKYKDFYESLSNARDLAEILFNKRLKRGAIEFDFIESKIKLDDNQNPIEIKPYERRVSNKMIEEFMLLANETIAKHFYDMDVPFVYRVHEVPEAEKIDNLKDFAHSYDLVLKGNSDNLRPMDIQKMLDSIEDETAKKAVSMVVLRTLRQARYSPNNLEHFGLAAKYYTHFTSPIRRYPDLQIHRIIKEIIDGKFDEKRRSHYESILDDVCTNSSEKERNAEACERAVVDFYNALYMKAHEGEMFDGFVSGVTNFGFFVELENGIEGLVRLSSLADYYTANTKYYTLESTSGDIIKLGQNIMVEVDFVDIVNREIDFKIPMAQYKDTY